jgi:hypothetical protein
LKSSVFWGIMLCSPMKVSWHFRGTYCHHLHGQRISQARNKHDADSKLSSLVYSVTLKVKVICSSETMVYFHQTTQQYIPEDRTLQSYNCEKLNPKGRRLLHASWTEMPLFFLNFCNAKECTGFCVSISILKNHVHCNICAEMDEDSCRFLGLHHFYWTCYGKE